MELKTKVLAVDNKQEIIINREFDLPVALVFKAYIEPEIIEEWMRTRVLKLENKKHGNYIFETTDPQGNPYRFSGVIHDIIQNEKIIRTFEMEKTKFTVQLEFLEFKKLSEDKSRLSIHTIFRSVEERDQLMQMPFAKGLNLAHNRLESYILKTR